MADPNLSSFIWSVADLLRGDYKQSEYGKVMLRHGLQEMAGTRLTVPRTESSRPERERLEERYEMFRRAG